MLRSGNYYYVGAGPTSWCISNSLPGGALARGSAEARIARLPYLHAIPRIHQAAPRRQPFCRRRVVAAVVWYGLEVRAAPVSISQSHTAPAQHWIWSTPGHCCLTALAPFPKHNRTCHCCMWLWCGALYVMCSFKTPHQHRQRWQYDVGVCQHHLRRARAQYHA